MVTVQLRQGSTVFATLTIADGMTTSNVVDGFGLAPLLAAGAGELGYFFGADGVGGVCREAI